MSKWTKGELADISDAAFINAILSERAASLKRYTPLERKIREVQNRLRTGNKFDEGGNLCH